MPTRAESSPQEVIRRLVEMVRRLLEKNDRRPLAAIGIGCAGPLDPESGLILSPPNLPGWDAIPLRDILQNEFGVPVFIDNDANAAALGEQRFGAGIGVDNFAYVTISTGIGSGLIVNGGLVHGIRASAGEIGHQTVFPDGPLCRCGNRGCLGMMASGPAIARRAQEAIRREGGEAIVQAAGGELTKVKTKHVVEALRAGHPLARQVWQETIEYLGIGLANLITILAPEMVVIGGGVAKAGDLLFVPLRQEIAKRVFLVPFERVRIVPSKLGDDVALLGAVTLALDGLRILAVVA